LYKVAAVLQNRSVLLID